MPVSAFGPGVPGSIPVKPLLAGRELPAPRPGFYASFVGPFHPGLPNAFQRALPVIPASNRSVPGSGPGASMRAVSGPFNPAMPGAFGRGVPVLPPFTPDPNPTNPSRYVTTETVISREPRPDDGDPRQRRNSNVLAEIVNSLHRQGVLVRTEFGEWMIVASVDADSHAGLTGTYPDIVTAARNYLYEIELANGTVQAVSFGALRAVDFPLSGVVPGEYVRATVRVDEYGRVVEAANGEPYPWVPMVLPVEESFAEQWPTVPVPGPTGADGRPGADAMAWLEGDVYAEQWPNPGPAGPKGDTGERGLPGADGEPGIDGERGPAGADGKPGADGQRGMDAWAEETGEPWPVVPVSGPAGADGKPGADAMAWLEDPGEPWPVLPAVSAAGAAGRDGMEGGSAWLDDQGEPWVSASPTAAVNYPIAVALGGTGSATVPDGLDNLRGTPVTLASAATVNIGAADADYIFITGTTNITSFGTATAGTTRVLYFSGASLAVGGASIIGSYTVVATDVMTVRYDGSTWTVVAFKRQNLTQTVNANQVYAGPESGSVAVPTFRALVAADLPIQPTSASADWLAAVGEPGEPWPAPPVLPSRLPDVQTFTANGTWTKPYGAVLVRIQCIGGGGGGGSGRRGANLSAKGGGGGGAGGGYAEVLFPASVLGATETVTIGAGGAGGAAPAGDNTDGNAGSAGSDTTFGSWVRGKGSLPGQGGTTAGGAAGNPVGFITMHTGYGGLGSAGSVPAGVNGTTAQAEAAVYNGASGGGGGGGVDASNYINDGGTGGTVQPALRGGSGQAGGAGGARGNTGTAGSAGSTGTSYVGGASPGSGGGGGGAGNVNGGGAGGAGGNYGGGGGGGGGGTNGSANGAGGAGASGLCIVTTYF